MPSVRPLVASLCTPAGSVGKGHLVSVTGGSYSAQFTYDGDGQRVQSLINGETIVFVGGYYEVKSPRTADQEITKYYSAGAARVAMRKYVIPENGTLTYLLGDHLGSASLAVDSADLTNVVETRYSPWGEVRYTTPGKTLPTRYTFTGQYSYVSDQATDAPGFGLLYFNARWVDPELGRFAQADSIIPEQTQGVQAWDRYAFVNNNPVLYSDPSGHCLWDLCILEISGATFGIVELAAAVGVTTATIYVTYSPAGQQAREDLAQTIAETGEKTVDDLSQLMKGEYIPPILRGEAERAAYREAVERYKKRFGIDAAVNVPKDILDGIAEDVNNGVKPVDAVDNAAEAPDGDLTKKGKPLPKDRQSDDWMDDWMEEESD